MMRYQRVSHDFLTPTNSDQLFDAVGTRSGPESTDPSQTHDTTNNNPDLMLKWGHKKRSRHSRLSNDDSGLNSRRNMKIQKRAAAIAGAEKIAAAAAASEMLKAQSNGGEHGRGDNLTASVPLRYSTGARNNRTVEEKSNGQKRSPSSSSSQHNHNNNNNGFGSGASPSVNLDPKPTPEHETSGTCHVAAEKVKLEWPRIYVTLSRKEKEDDFFALKGTKLPHRPKKRAKNVDKALQYCYPGMWLSDLTRGRYEVREKKCVKKGALSEYFIKWYGPQEL